jgi:hypothetical protein
MVISLGDEFDPDIYAKVFCIRSNFKKDQYLIIDKGFLISDYYVEFADEKYVTLFHMLWNEK